MSEISPQTGRSLYEYGKFLRTSLIIGIIMLASFIGFFYMTLDLPPEALDAIASGNATFDDYGINSSLISFLTLLLVATGIAFLVYQIRVLTRLGRAKTSSADRYLRLTFNLTIISIIASVVSFLFTNEIIQLILNLISLVCSPLAYWYYNKFIKNTLQSQNIPQGAQKVQFGVGLIIFQTVLSLVLDILTLVGVGANSVNYTIITLILGVVISGIGQYLVAIGTISLFTEFTQAQPYSGVESPFQGTIPNYGTQYGTGTSFGSLSDSTTNIPSDSQSNVPISPKPSVSMKKCPMCDGMVGADAEYCNICGTKFE